MNANQFLKWRVKQLTGKGDKYYPASCLDALRDSVKITHWGGYSLEDAKAYVSGEQDTLEATQEVAPEATTATIDKEAK